MAEDDHRFADRMTTILSHMNSINNRLMQSALRGTMSEGVVEECQRHLKHIHAGLAKISAKED